MTSGRHTYGGGIADWAITHNASGQTLLLGGATITFWSAETGGLRYIDLTADPDGTQPITQVLTSDGTDGRALGQIPPLYGPPKVKRMWAAANDGPRVLMHGCLTTSTDLTGDVNIDGTLTITGHLILNGVDLTTVLTTLTAQAAPTSA